MTPFPDLAALSVAFVLSVALLPVAPVRGLEPGTETDENWPQFLGPQGMAVSGRSGLPERWSNTDNVEWVASIPGMAWSSPIVWGDRVFVTTASSEKPMKQPSLGVDFSNEYVAELVEQGKTMDEVMAAVAERDGEMPDEITLSYHLLCLDLESGEVLWDRLVHEGPPPVGRHRKNSYASETPVTDGEAVYVFIGHLALFAFDFEGAELWRTPVDAHQVYLDFGSGASPALHEDRLFIVNDNEEASFIAAYDTASGRRLWRTARPGLGTGQMRSGWSTPFVWRNELRTEVIAVGPGAAISYDLDGDELWRFPHLSGSTIQSPFAWGDLLFVSSGTARDPNKPVVAFRPGASGEIALPEDGESDPHIAWHNPAAGGSYLPTPLILDDALYVLSDKGILSKYDAGSGERIHRARVDRGAGNFTASPWAYEGKIFALNEEGDTFVVGAGDELELIRVNSLDEFSMATPALAGDRLLIRTQSKLYSIRNH
jgi:outer membrane protein assembly factor BamB